MVTTGDPAATRAALEVLRAGGSAADAAVAAAFTLAVALPQAGNLGGGGFALVRDAASGEIQALDFRERAPERAGFGTFLDQRGELIPQRSTVGATAAGVPGSVAGLVRLHGRFGRLPWKRLLRPAIELARTGFEIRRPLADAIAAASDKLGRFESTKAIFFHETRPLREGERLIQRDLSRTLERIAKDGAGGFYAGRTARLIAATSRAGGGLITKDDLALYRALWRAPLRNDWNGLAVWSMPLPSSGGITLAEAMNILEPFHLRQLGVGGSAYINLVAEACKMAFFDRARFLGDSDYNRDLPVAKLVSKEYARELRSRIRMGRSGEVGQETGLLEPVHTTHLVIADSRGNIVTLTTTINDSFGSGLVVAGAGFLLNDEMDDFAAQPGAPNLYGLTGGIENSVAPGKRMLSSMAPTIVTRNGRPLLALGARGGPRIITTVMQVLFDVAVFGMNVQEALDLPRFHHQGQPPYLFIEPSTLSPDSRDALCEMGYRFQRRDALSGCYAVAFDEGGLEGAADPRYDGLAAGF